MKNYNLNVYANVILVFTLLVGCTDNSSFKVNTPLVETYTIPKKNTENLQNFPAIVSASDLTKLSFRVNGELVNLPASNGKEVKKGDLIAKIDPTTFELTVKDRKAKVEIAKLSMGRAEKMVALGNMAQSVFDELEAKYRVAKAQYEYAILQLSFVELRAPFDGIVANVPADNFQSTEIGQLVAIMHRTDKIEIKVDLPDVILAAADQNNDNRDNIKFDLILDAYPGHVFSTLYKEHTTEQTNQDKKYILVLEMPVDTQRLALQGMPGSVSIDLEKLKPKNVDINAVPIESVLLPDNISPNSGELLVWRVNKDSTVESVRVKSEGLSDSTFMNVLGDLHEGDQVVISGMMYLQDGLSVNVRQPRGTAK